MSSLGAALSALCRGKIIDRVYSVCFLWIYCECTSTRFRSRPRRSGLLDTLTGSDVKTISVPCETRSVLRRDMNQQREEHVCACTIENREKAKASPSGSGSILLDCRDGWRSQLEGQWHAEAAIRTATKPNLAWSQSGPSGTLVALPSQSY